MRGMNESDAVPPGVEHGVQPNDPWISRDGRKKDSIDWSEHVYNNSIYNYIYIF